MALRTYALGYDLVGRSCLLLVACSLNFTSSAWQQMYLSYCKQLVYLRTPTQGSSYRHASHQWEGFIHAEPFLWHMANRPHTALRRTAVTERRLLAG